MAEVAGVDGVGDHLVRRSQCSIVFAVGSRIG